MAKSKSKPLVGSEWTDASAGRLGGRWKCVAMVQVGVYRVVQIQGGCRMVEMKASSVREWRDSCNQAESTRLPLAK